MTGLLLYVYALVPAPTTPRAAPDSGGLSGIEERPVRLLAEGGVAVALSDVPAAEFDEGPLNERLRDLDWLAPRAAAHQAVNAALHAALESVLPLSFGTVFRDETSVRALLRTRQAELQARLAALAGRAEWVVALQRDHAGATAWIEQHGEALGSLRAEMGASTPGRSYLLARRLDDVRRQELLRLDAAAVQATFAAVGPAVEQSFREPVAAPAGTDAGGVIARASLLVPKAAPEAVLAAVERFNGTWTPRGYELRCTGPWPPYRFGGLEAAAGRTAGEPA